MYATCVLVPSGDQKRVSRFSGAGVAGSGELSSILLGTKLRPSGRAGCIQPWSHLFHPGFAVFSLCIVCTICVVCVSVCIHAHTWRSQRRTPRTKFLSELESSPLWPDWLVDWGNSGQLQTYLPRYVAGDLHWGPVRRASTLTHWALL